MAKDVIPLCEPYLCGNEREYVLDCIATNWVSSVGSYVDRFEAAVAQASGTDHAVATNSGTAALHVALLVAGVAPGDEVLVPTLTFIAPVNAICYVGARPVLVDVDPEYWQMDADLVERFLRDDCERRPEGIFNKVSGRRVSAILPVHVLGHPAPIDRLVAVAAEFGLAVIEDATESLGATWRGQPLGGLGDVGCFSFNGNKLITTGGGGMLVSHRADWAGRARYLTTQAKDDPLEYEHGEVGFNYRLTNIQAAIGVGQMERLNEYLAAKRRIADRYAAALAQVPGVRCPREHPEARSAWWLYTILIDPQAFGRDSRDLLRVLQVEGIQTRPLWQPMHLSKVHGACLMLGGSVAAAVHARGLSLPSSVSLTEAQQDRVIAAIMAACLGGVH